MKIAILGGSSVGTPELVLALRRQFAQPPAEAITLVLHGRSADRLSAVGRAAAALAESCTWLRIATTTDLAEAVSDARVIVNQVRVGGLSARADDETFPLAHDMLGEETVGAGGFANAARTVPAVVAMMRAVEQHAPDALVLSFTNPASVIQYAVARSTRLRTIGLCDASIAMTAQAAQALGCAASELAIDYVGMHHFSFIPRVYRDGADVTGDVMANLGRITGFDMDPDAVAAFGVLPTPYFKYFLHPERMLARQRAQTQSRGAQLLDVEDELLRAYAEQTPDALHHTVAKRGAKWYDAIIAPVLRVLAGGGAGEFVLNVTNNGALPWLPADAIIETRCSLDADGVPKPLPQRATYALNPDLIARIQANNAYEQLIVRAFLERDRGKAMRALTMNPLVGSVDKARAVLSKTWAE
jgi:6-phospho-beta-glucosidase